MDGQIGTKYSQGCFETLNTVIDSLIQNNYYIIPGSNRYVDMFIRVGPISPKCSRGLFRRHARLESERVRVFLVGATSHEPPTRLRFEPQSRKRFLHGQEQVGDFFFQDSFKEPPGFWGLQMLVSIKVQPQSEAGAITFPTFALTEQSQLGHLRDFYTTVLHKSTEAFSFGAGNKAALKTCCMNHCVSDP